MSDELPDLLEILQDRRSTELDRREFIAYMSASLAASACTPGGSSEVTPPDDEGGRDAGRDADSTAGPPDGDDAGRDAGAEEEADSFDVSDIPSDPFELGVASGDPTDDGVVLWTRLIPEPPEGGGMPDGDVPVTWEIAEAAPPIDGVVAGEFDEAAIVQSGTATAESDWAHSVHVEVEGLDPDAWYLYRFRVGDEWTSRVGRTRTLPRTDASPDSFNVATTCCQSYPEGYYTPHHHVAREDELDAVLFLGDYIYDTTAGEIMRQHPGGIPETIDEFRRRYAVYKSEPQLIDAHAHCPWILTWDDHEVRNNYADVEEPTGDYTVEEFKQIRAAAYRAYYEHLPLRVPERPDDASLEIYRSFQVGDLVELNVLDGRQYRSGITCGGEVGSKCDEATDPAETMLGDEQFDWLAENLRTSSTLWQAVVQQTVFTPVNFNNTFINPDMWDGYQAERQRLIDVLAGDDVPNPVMLTGDIHMGAFLDIPRNDDDPGEDPVCPEVVATSVTSENTLGDFSERLADGASVFGQVRYLNPDDRGYTVVKFRRGDVIVHYRTVSTVHETEASLATDTSYRIEADTGKVTELL